jgi:hypothetical protein
LMKAGEVGIDPRSGRFALMKYMRDANGGVNELAMPRRRAPVTIDMEQ